MKEITNEIARRIRENYPNFSTATECSDVIGKVVFYDKGYIVGEIAAIDCGMSDLIYAAQIGPGLFSTDYMESMFEYVFKIVNELLER